MAKHVKYFSIFSTLLVTEIVSVLVCGNLHAAIIQNSVVVGGASRATQITDNQWRVYGSFLGPQGPSGTNTFFDSCSVDLPASTNFVGCNSRRIMGSSVLTVSFSDDVQYQGQKTVLAYIRQESTINPRNLNTNPTLYSQGSIYQAQITWASLCTEAGGVIGNYTTASTALGGLPAEACLIAPGGEPLNKSVQLAVGVASDNGTVASSEVVIDLRLFTTPPSLGLFAPTLGAALEGSDGFSNVTPCEKSVSPASGGAAVASGSLQGSYTGFCDYRLIPGDEKIRMLTDDTVTNSLDIYIGTIGSGGLTGVPYAGFILYLSDNYSAGFNETLPWNAPSSFTNLFNSAGNVDSGFQDGTISTSIVKNETAIFSRMASLDQAGNVTHLFSDAVIAANCAGIPANDADPNYYRFFVGQVPDGDAPPFTGMCPYATVPSLVTGLLTEDVNCFVATALTGSPYDYQVLALREFRNRFLKSFSLGQAFIDFYYAKGPIAAKWLNQNPEFKPFFRVLLWPTYLVAKVFNLFGALIGLVFLFLILATPFVALKLQRKTFIKI